MVEVPEVEKALRRLFMEPAATAKGRPPGLRVEDLKKARELSAFLDELDRVGRRQLVVDAAAGHGYVGLVGAELLGGIEHLVLLERETARSERAAAAGRKLRTNTRVESRLGDVADDALWPTRPDVVVALHACGSAADVILRQAARSEARWILVAPCCYGNGLPFAAEARRHAERIGLPRHAEIRRRFLGALIDAERALELEAAGYEVLLVPFVAPTVTPHNLLYRARRVGETGRMRAARAQLTRLRA